MQMADLLLPHLMPGNYNDRICVRVSRFWDFCDPNDEKKLLHSDMVLIDEEVWRFIYVLPCSVSITSMPLQYTLLAMAPFFWIGQHHPCSDLPCC